MVIVRTAIAALAARKSIFIGVQLHSKVRFDFGDKVGLLRPADLNQLRRKQPIRAAISALAFDPMRRTARREHLMSVIREPWNQARAEKAGTAGDENLHGHTHFDLDLQMAFIA